MTGWHVGSLFVLDDEIVLEQGRLESAHLFAVEMSKFLKWFVVRVEDEFFSLQVFVEMIHPPDTGAAASSRNGE